MNTKSLLLLIVAGCSARPAASSRSPRATEAEANAAYAAQQWPKCTESYASIADGATGKSREQALYNAACCAARGGASDRAFSLLDSAVVAGFMGVDQARADEDLVSLRADPRWTRLLANVAENKKIWVSKLGDPALFRELEAMMTEDQRVRNVADDSPASEAATRAVDARNTARMKQVVAGKGWPGKALVGAFGAQAAWALVQHADADVAFQKECLPLLEKAVASGDALPDQYAYLYDRVAVNENRPQRYGTQMIDGEPRPIEEPANVDVRRKAVGLEPLAAYVKHLRERAASAK